MGVFRFSFSKGLEGENFNPMTSLIHKYMEWEEVVFTSNSGLQIWQFSLRPGFVIVSSETWKAPVWKVWKALFISMRRKSYISECQNNRWQDWGTEKEESHYSQTGTSPAIKSLSSLNSVAHSLSSFLPNIKRGTHPCLNQLVSST